MGKVHSVGNNGRHAGSVRASWPAQRLALLTLAVSAMLAHAAPSPILAAGQPVDWWFAFKFNAQTFPGCGQASATNTCAFGGTLRAPLQAPSSGYSQQYVYASSTNAVLQQGSNCLGTTPTDPVGATFGQVYQGSSYYVVWNDQFYSAPDVAHCGKSCSAPWGHSKGLLAWDDTGNGLVMQVSTPSWPAAASQANPRSGDGNTLGCIASTDNIMVSQHFFALRLNRADVRSVLLAMQTASVVTDPTNPQIVRNGGPQEIQDLVSQLGTKSQARTVTSVPLSTGVRIIAKPARLQVPPWQLVSTELQSAALKVASWWEADKPSQVIPSTDGSTAPACWDSSLAKPGPVINVLAGQWGGTPFSLTGGLGKNHNHAKLGISTSGDRPYAIFGDMNQEGTLAGKCGASQNGRGGMFFVVEDAALNRSLGELIGGAVSPPTN